MSLREWLILLGAVIVIGIILDGIRRMHRARKDSLEISRGMGVDQLEESPLDNYNPELPGGGARIIGGLETHARQKDEAANRPMPHRYDQEFKIEEGAQDDEEPGLSARDRDDRLPEDFPMHAESRSGAADQSWSGYDQSQAGDSHRQTVPERASSGQEDIPTLKKAPSSSQTQEKPEGAAPGGPRRPWPTRSRQSAKARKADQKSKQKSETSTRPPAGANRPPAKEVFVINVDSKTPEGFPGSDLKRLFEACGLEHGDMGIYHRHENDDTETPVQFSVANAVEPGTFSPAEMNSMHTPAISFFMSLPGPTDSLKAYDFMVETAQVVVRNLGGDLKDERRSVVTAQTIEHGRQRVREFERKRRSVKV